MRVICAWCGSLLQDGPDDKPVSHGLCMTCKAREFPEAA